MESKSRGVLDRPVKPDDDSSIITAIASEAKQSSLIKGSWIASSLSLLAMRTEKKAGIAPGLLFLFRHAPRMRGIQ